MKLPDTPVVVLYIRKKITSFCAKDAKKEVIEFIKNAVSAP